MPSLITKLWQGNYDVYVKCINGRFALPVTYLIARLKNRPFILWTGMDTRLQTPFHRLFYPVIRYIYRHADAIVVYGEHVKRFLEGEGVLSERIFVAAHAVDNAAYNFQVPQESKNILYQKLGIGPEEKVILYLGRLEPVKGLTYLLDAFAKLCDRCDKSVVLVIAGTGSEEHLLQKIVRDKGLSECVRFVGYVPPNETIIYYSIAWVYVLPSITTRKSKELWGLVINEAFNQGIPVITTEAVGAAAGGLVQDGVNGFIVPERDPIALAKQMTKLLNDRSMRMSFGKNAREIIEKWDNEAMVIGFQEAIDYVLSRPE
ncbi:MAG: glycosyltransferase [Chloroflexi bacterium]|nr:glycosyltransferase [Chloroflexota bacterium]